MLLSSLIPLVISLFFIDSVFTRLPRRKGFPRRKIKDPEKYVPCENGWYFLDDKCYKIEGYEKEEDRIPWKNASARCCGLGSKLASIHSKEQNSLLSAFLVLNVKETVWIGLSDERHESRYMWEDRTAFDYSNWKIGQPDNENNNEHCVQLSADPSIENFGKWNDLSCLERSGYICQKEKNDSLKALDQRFCSAQKGGGWKFRENCYTIINNEETWGNAENHCILSFSGHLAAILNSEQNFFLSVLLSKYKPGHWIGIKAQHSYHEKWISGWPVAYNHFDRPVEALDSGTCILRIRPYIWTPVDCKEKHNYICETSLNNEKPPVVEQYSKTAHCPSYPHDWRDLGGEYCYYIDVESRVTWFQAQRICLRRGSLLASITSKEEEEILHSVIRHTRVSVFVGLSARLTNGNFTLWSDGSMPTYTHWNAFGPPIYSTFCGEVSSLDMSWSYVSCFSLKGFICKIKKIETTGANEAEEEVNGGNSTILASNSTDIETGMDENTETIYEAYEYNSPAKCLNNSLEKCIPCEEGWYYFEGKCYKLEGYNDLFPSLTYSNASRRCSEIGGNLASIHSKEENDFITYFLALNLGTVNLVWIGLNNKKSDSHFIWEDESLLDYQNWKNELPVSGTTSEDCVVLSTDTTDDAFSKWIRKSCDNYAEYICQKERNETLLTPDPLSCSSDNKDAFKFQHKCFNVINNTESWDDAELYCQTVFNGHLVSILDEKQDAFLGLLFAKFESPPWIGIKIQDHYQQKWTSGSFIAYRHFDMQLEDLQNGTCILRWNQNFWITADCSEAHPFVCEIDTNGPLALAQPSSELRCPEFPHGWQDFGGEYCYFIDTTRYITWFQAQSRCISMGGLLATIYSRELESIIHHFVRHKHEGIFIGLNSLLTDGAIFYWSDGSQINYTHWGPKEPNNYHEMCGEIWTWSMEWNDIPCREKKSFICQIKKVKFTNENMETKETTEVTTEMIVTERNGNLTDITYANEDEAAPTTEVSTANEVEEKKVEFTTPAEEVSKETDEEAERKEETPPINTSNEEKQTKEAQYESRASTEPNKEEKQHEAKEEVTLRTEIEDSEETKSFFVSSNVTLVSKKYKLEKQEEHTTSTTSETVMRGLYVSLAFIAVLLGVWAYYSRKWIKQKTEILTTVFYRPSATLKEVQSKWSAEIILDKTGEETYI